MNIKRDWTMKTKYTIQEVTAAIARQDQLQENCDIANAAVQSVVSVYACEDGHIPDAVKFSESFRGVKEVKEKAHASLASFNSACGGKLLMAMHFVRNPVRYASFKKYVEVAK